MESEREALRLGRWISDGRSSSPSGHFDWPGACGTQVLLTASVALDRQGIQAPNQDWASSQWSASGGGGPLSQSGVAWRGPCLGTPDWGLPEAGKRGSPIPQTGSVFQFAIGLLRCGTQSLADYRVAQRRSAKAPLHARRMHAKRGKLPWPFQDLSIFDWSRPLRGIHWLAQLSAECYQQLLHAQRPRWQVHQSPSPIRSVPRVSAQPFRMPRTRGPRTAKLLGRSGCKRERHFPLSPTLIILAQDSAHQILPVEVSH